MDCGIYKITFPHGKCYVGSSRNIPIRWVNHRSSLRHGKHCNIKMQRAYAKHAPKGDLIFELLLVCREEDLLMYEQAAIDALKPELNISTIAGRIEHTPEMIERNRERAVEQWSDSDMRAAAAERARQAMSDPKRKAVNASNAKKLQARLSQNPEYKEALSKQARDFWADESNRERKSQHHKEVCADPEYREAMKERSRANWADPVKRANVMAGLLKPETKGKQAEACRRNWANPEYRARMLETRRAAKERRERSQSATTS